MKQEAGVLPGLSDSDKALQARLFAHPMDFPQEFRAWLKKFAQADPPRLPLSEMSGYEGLVSQGTYLDYAQIVADSAGITATTEGTAVAVITGNSVAYDGNRVKVEVFIPGIVPSTNLTATLVLLRGSTVLGQVPTVPEAAGSSLPPVVKAEFFDTPAAGTYVYSVALFVSGGNAVVKAGAGGSAHRVPAFLCVTKAV